MQPNLGVNETNRDFLLSKYPFKRTLFITIFAIFITSLFSLVFIGNPSLGYVVYEGILAIIWYFLWIDMMKSEDRFLQSSSLRDFLQEHLEILSRSKP